MAFNRLAYRKITGAAEMIELFRQLPWEVRQHVVSTALPMAARPMLAEQVRLAPRSTGPVAAYRRKHGKPPLYTTPIVNMGMFRTRAAANNNDALRSTGRGKGFDHVVFARIGPKYPEGAHAHLLEFGTADRYVNARSHRAPKVLVMRRSGRLVTPANAKANRWGNPVVVPVTGTEVAKPRYVPYTKGRFRYSVVQASRWYRGKGPIRAFMKPAYDHKWQQCMGILQAQCERGHQQYVDKMISRMPKPVGGVGGGKAA